VGTPIAIFTAPGDDDAEISRALADAGVNSAAAAEAAPTLVELTPSPSIAEPQASLVVDQQPALVPFSQPAVRQPLGQATGS